MTKPPTVADLVAISRALVDQGKLVEAGWIGYRWAVLPEDASPVQLHETRKGFFAGASHLFASIMNMLEEGAEPTPADLRRLDHIHAELEAFSGALREGTTPEPSMPGRFDLAQRALAAFVGARKMTTDDSTWAGTVSVQEMYRFVRALGITDFDIVFPANGPPVVTEKIPRVSSVNKVSN